MAKGIILSPTVIQGATRIPEGYTTDNGISLEWHGFIVLDMTSERYAGLILKKGDKVYRLSWDEIERRLGIEW